jgi:DNA processing protein
MISLFPKVPHPNPLPEGRGLKEGDRLDWLRLIRTDNVGPVTFYRLLETYGSAGDALAALPELSKRGGRQKPLTPPPAGVVEHELEQLHQLGGTVILATDAAYPLALGAVEDAPPVLSVIGNISLLQKQSIAIVGARNASLNGKRFAGKLAQDLGAAQYVVTSGLARGIDTAAHEGSIAAGTIAVVAGGIDIVYPPENKKLYDQICEQGLIVAESAFGQQPFAQSFPRRNRIVSGLSAGVVVVEATERSGSLITARMAGEQGRDVYAVPGHPLDPRAGGPNKLIRDGAILVRDANDILEGLRNFSGGLLREVRMQAPYAAPMQVIDNADIDRARAALAETLSFAPSDINELIRASGFPASLVQTALLELELAGRIQRLPGNRAVLI